MEPHQRDERAQYGSGAAGCQPLLKGIISHINVVKYNVVVAKNNFAILYEKSKFVLRDILFLYFS